MRLRRVSQKTNLGWVEVDGHSMSDMNSLRRRFVFAMSDMIVVRVLCGPLAIVAPLCCEFKGVVRPNAMNRVSSPGLACSTTRFQRILPTHVAAITLKTRVGTHDVWEIAWFVEGFARSRVVDEEFAAEEWWLRRSVFAK